MADVGIGDHCHPLLSYLQVLTVANKFIDGSVCYIEVFTPIGKKFMALD